MVFKTGKNQGFTLVEVAIVMLIGGILTAAAAASLSVYMKKTKLDVTQKRLDTINEALQTFVNQNGSYPCPAFYNAAPDTANFGVQADCNAAPGAPTETIRAAGRALPAPVRNVRMGAVPVRTLNLPDDYIADGWGGRFTYAVTERLTLAATYNADEGGIFVNDRNNNPVIVTPAAGSGHYVVVSHGENRSGAVPTNGGGGVPACAAGALETENCNDDATFRSTLLISQGTDQFDDLIRARSVNSMGGAIPIGAVMAFDLPACPAGWGPYANADGRVVVGVGTGYALRDVGGDDAPRITTAQIPVEVPGGRVTPTAAASGVVYLRASASGIATTALDNRQRYLALRYCQKIS